MNEIINVDVRVDHDTITTDSRNVADVFGKRHDHVIRDIENLKKDTPNFGEMFFEGTKPDTYGRDQKVFVMNRDGFMLLAMGFTGSDAIKWKIKYIDAFNMMERELNTPEMVMARGLKAAQLVIEQKDQIIKELTVDNERMKPKEVFADAVTASDSSILVREFAKMMRQNGLNTGEKRLYRWFRENGYVCKGRSTEPTQRAMEMGLFERIVRTVQKGDGLPLEKATTKITGKGQVYFANKLLKEATHE